MDFPGRRGCGAGFGLWIFRAGGGAGAGFGLWIPVVAHILLSDSCCGAHFWDSGCGAHFLLGYPLWRTFFIRAPVVAHIFHSDSRYGAYFAFGFPLWRTYY